MSLNRRLKCETPIKRPRDGIVLGLVMRASLGCIGLSAVIVLLERF